MYIRAPILLAHFGPSLALLDSSGLKSKNLLFFSISFNSLRLCSSRHCKETPRSLIWCLQLFVDIGTPYQCRLSRQKSETLFPRYPYLHLPRYPHCSTRPFLVSHLVPRVVISTVRADTKLRDILLEGYRYLHRWITLNGRLCYRSNVFSIGRENPGG